MSGVNFGVRLSCPIPRAQRLCIGCRAFTETFYFTSLFDVLHLLPELFDLHFDFYSSLTESDTHFIQPRSLRKDCSYLSIHLLKNEIHTLAGFITECLQAG